ncbi:MAG: Glutamyl-tRNA(Gln) amidotransferase subunit A, partial [Parcubacteria group bacterium GW2011_GWC2_52_8c]
MASSLDQIGPIAKTVEDAAILYQAIAGQDRYDATSAAVPVEAMREVPLAGLRIGVPREYFGAGLDPRVAKAIRASLNKFEAAGAILMDISLP